MEKALGRELSASGEIRQRQQLERQNQQQVRTTKDAVVDALPQASPGASVSPLNPIVDGSVAIEDSTQLEAIVAGVEETHLPSPEEDERNREYLIRRAAHLVAAIASSKRSEAHDRGNVVFGGFLHPPFNGFSSDCWALITALTP